ncbi:hypothetical protein RND81_04G022700 [Saponaria officinalis]|uniref:CCHC-type domain-containing protein n=1 Tax=Saponaria officinalis TaxID=3572 RepID=A0AAW1LH46_SAPOF
MSSVLAKTLPNLTKLEQLDGNNYKRWSQKLMIFFEQLEIDYVLFSDPPAPVKETPAATTIENTPPVVSVVKSNEEAIKKFEKDNKTVRCQLLSNMTDTLFDLFMVHKSAKLIWVSLEAKYGADDAGKKKYVVGKWLEFQMVDGKPIMEEVHVYENLCADVVNEGMKLDDIFMANANLVESGGPSNFEKFKGKGKAKVGPGKNQGPIKKNGPGKHTKPVAKIQKPKGPIVCYVCGKTGHKSYQCTEKKTTEANVAVTDDVIAAVVVEANLVGNTAEWILDTGACRHLCADKGLFAEFEEVADGECVYMGNSTSVLITGKDKIFLKLTSGKTLALTNVFLFPRCVETSCLMPY